MSFIGRSLHTRGIFCLPGSALSLPGELPRALQGEAVGGRSDPLEGQGRVLLLLRGCCMFPGYSQLQITPGTFPRELFKKHIKAGATSE